MYESTVNNTEAKSELHLRLPETMSDASSPTLSNTIEDSSMTSIISFLADLLVSQAHQHLMSSLRVAKTQDQ